MPVKLHKEQIKVSEILCSEYARINVENDCIVPDINPDVLKVLRVSAKAFITQKNIQQDRAYIQGVIRVNLLYLPEDDLCGKIKCINTSLDFSHFIEAKGAKQGMLLSAEAECESVTSELLNSRKLGIRCTLGINIKITSQTECEIATSEEDNTLEIKRVPLKILSYAPDSERELVISERLELPPGKPSVYELLKTDAKAVIQEVKALEGKATVRGELKFSLLYSGGAEEESEGTIEFAEFTLPFTEVVEGTEIKEGMGTEAECVAKSISCRIEAGENGDNTCLNTEILLGITVKVSELTEFFAIEDAYSTECCVALNKNAYSLERFLSSDHMQLPQKELFEVPEYLPGIKKVCDICAVPAVTDISISDGAVLVRGTINVNLLYITHSSELPVAGCECMYEFSHSFHMPEVSENAVCEASVSSEHLSYTLAGERNIELRLITAIVIKCISQDKTCLVDSVEETDEKPETFPEVILYFVQPGDTLWSIAKRFRTSVDTLKKDNDIECLTDGTTKLSVGDMLKIIL